MSELDIWGEQIFSNEELSHLVRQLIGSSLAQQTLLKGIFKHLKENPESIEAIKPFVQAERESLEILKVNDVQLEFDRVLFEITDGAL